MERFKMFRWGVPLGPPASYGRWLPVEKKVTQGPPLSQNILPGEHRTKGFQPEDTQS